jgi:hypothetical protein
MNDMDPTCWAMGLMLSCFDMDVTPSASATA